ncbi:MAG: universal stress protein [Proteobacteria bacterium]|jgi:universal stress protein A|nr:universal stress protein [Pseudomonadota bacterium]
MTYKKILAAIDLTDEAAQVLNQASQTAKQNGAELSLIVVVKPINQVYSGFDVAALAADAALIEADAVRQAESRLVEHGKALGIPATRTFVGRGNPAHEIREMASELGVDLIILGTHGRHGLGLLLGSTATGVLHGCPCDVLTVRIK